MESISILLSQLKFVFSDHLNVGSQNGGFYFDLFFMYWLLFFGDIGIANAFPSPFPGMRLEMAIGSGIGLPRGNKFRIGGSNLGPFIQGQVLFSEKFQGSATYQWGKPYLESGIDASNRQIFIGLQYRILK